MGRRKEERIAISYPVVVRGFDFHGVPFTVRAKTHDISATGVSLIGLEGRTQPGKKIEIEYKGKKAWYRVERVDKADGSSKGRVGARCLEPRKNIWELSLEKASGPDTFDVSIVAPQVFLPRTLSENSRSSTLGTRERRQFTRHSCRIEAQIAAQGAYEAISLRGTIVDISLGGCYLEMLAPLPEETAVEITFRAATADLRLSGNVCSSQEGFGMGVAFTGMSPEDFEGLRQFTCGSPDVADNVSPYAQSVRSAISSDPQRQAPPQQPQASTDARSSQVALSSDSGALNLPAAPAALEAIVRLLLRKGLLTPGELSEEYEKLKAAHR